jgi:meiotically up-regulated gene 157 (Mug157) protein
MNTQVNAMTRLIFERKFEIDSLLAFLKLANSYYNATLDLTPFRDPQFINAVGVVLQGTKEEQSKNMLKICSKNMFKTFNNVFKTCLTPLFHSVLGRQQISPLESNDGVHYTFLRQTTTPTDTLAKGVGPLWRSTGMLATPFR